jgi:hypothetical protein
VRFDPLAVVAFFVRASVPAVMAGLVPAIHAAPPKDRSSMSAPLAKAYWDKAFRSLLLAHGIRCAEHVDGRDKPGHDVFKAGGPSAKRAQNHTAPGRPTDPTSSP